MNRKECENQQYRLPDRMGILSGVLLLMTGWAPLHAGTIRISPEAIVTSPSVLLGQMAELEGFDRAQTVRLRDLVVGEAPQPGDSQKITFLEVRSALEDAHVNLATVYIEGSSWCLVRRPTELDPMDESVDSAMSSTQDPTLRGFIQSYLEGALRRYQGAVVVEFARGTEQLLELTSPPYQFSVRHQGGAPMGSVELDVTIESPANKRQQANVLALVSIRKNVVVATGVINRGQKVCQADLGMQEQTFDRPERIPMVQSNAIDGMQAKRLIRPGDLIRASDVQTVPLVRRNELIRVLSRSNGIVLESSGRALESGTLDDIVEVRNESSKESFRARVVGLRQVEALSGPAQLVSQIPVEGSES